MTAFPILNRNDASAHWAPHTFIGAVGNGKVETFEGMARRCFAIVCTDRLNFEGDEDAHVIAVWLPIGRQVARPLRHGAQAYRVCDALLDRFPEFEARDPEGIIAREDEVVAMLRELKVFL